MNAVRGEEAVGDSLPQAVRIDRIAEIVVGVGVVLTTRRGCHADLKGRLEVVEDFPPVAVVAGAAAMALIDDDQVEEIGVVLPIEAGTIGVAGNRLIDGEVHLPALNRSAAGDLPTGVAKGCEGLCHRIVDQDVAIGEIQNAGSTVLACAIPAGVPKFPADLKRHDRFASARSHCEQDARFALRDGLHGSVNGDLLVVARGLAAEVVCRRQQPFGGVGGERLV